MKLKTLGIKNGDVYGSYKEAIVSTLIGYGKMYRLLHKQLWDKNRIAFVDHAIEVNGRNAKPIKYWNIKSYSTEAYSSNPADTYALGLNQLFADQSPYKEYEGNPKDGIYHDDCLIQPKSTPLESFDRFGWYIEGNGHWIEKSVWGETEIVNVATYEKFHDVPVMIPSIYEEDVYDANNVLIHSAGDNIRDENGDFILVQKVENGELVFTTESLGMYYSIEYLNDNPDERPEYKIEDILVNLGEEGSEYQTPELEYINFSKPNVSDELYEKYIEIPDLTPQHGEIVYEANEVPNIKPIGSFTQASLWTNPEAKTIIYADGTCIQINTATVWESSQEGDTILNYQDGAIKYLPLVYTDDGELVQNRIDFIDQWDSMYELYVHENSYWYTSIISIAVIIVGVVIAILSGFSAVGIMGAFIGGVGAVSGNKAFSVIGAVMMLGANIYEIGAKEIVAKEAATYSLRTSAEILADTSFSEIFTSFMNAAGLSNLVNIGSTAYSIYLTATTPEISETSQEETQDESMQVYAYSDEDDDVMSLINI